MCCWIGGKNESKSTNIRFVCITSWHWVKWVIVTRKYFNSKEISKYSFDECEFMALRSWYTTRRMDQLSNAVSIRFYLLASIGCVAFYHTLSIWRVLCWLRFCCEEEFRWFGWEFCCQWLGWSCGTWINASITIWNWTHHRWTVYEVN